MTILNLATSTSVSPYNQDAIIDANDIRLPEEITVPTFEYKAGIDPKVVMVIAISAFALLSVVFALGFRGVL